MKVTYNREQNALSILEELNGYRETRQHCNFVIKVGGEEIHVHRNILCANSEYFKAMLSHDTSENQTGCVELKDLDADCVLTCADFMYCQKVFVVDEKREKHLCTADFLQLHNLRESIAVYYKENLNENTFYATKKLANAYHCTDLEEKCDSFAVKNFEAIAQLDDYKDLTKEYITYLLESEENNTSATNKVKALLNWVRLDQASRESLLPAMLGGLPLSEVNIRYKHYLFNEEPLTSKSMICVKLLGNSLMPGPNSTSPTSRDGENQCGAIMMFDDTTKFLQCFDPKDQSLIQMHPLHLDFIRSPFSAVLLENFIYVLMQDKVVYCLDFTHADANWERIENTINDHGQWPPTITNKNFIFVVGCWAGQSESIEKFDPVTNSWKELTDRGVKRFSTPVLLNDGIYCIGGQENVQGNDKQEKKIHLNTVMVFDLISKVWNTAAPLLHARSRCAATTCLGKIYIAGGWCWQSLSYMECYDPTSNSWSKLTPMCQCRQAPQLFLIKAEMYAVGGYKQFPTTIEKYDIKENKWSLVEFPEKKELKVIWSVGICENQEERHCENSKLEESCQE